MSVVTSAAASTDSILTLSPNKAKECDLKLLISDAQILAGIFHLPSQTFIHILLPAFASKTDEKKIVTRFNDFINKNPVLRLTYNSVTASFLSQAVTFVPNALYDQSSKEDYLKLVEPVNAGKNIISDHKEGNGFTAVFSEDEKLVNTVKEKFPGCKLSHSANYLINTLQKEYTGDTTQRVFAYIMPDKLQLIVTGKDKPLFYNIFSYTTPEDFIYYILLVYKKLGFDRRKHSLYFWARFSLSLNYLSWLLNTFAILVLANGSPT